MNTEIFLKRNRVIRLSFVTAIQIWKLEDSLLLDFDTPYEPRKHLKPSYLHEQKNPVQASMLYNSSESAEKCIFLLGCGFLEQNFFAFFNSKDFISDNFSMVFAHFQ